MHTRSQRQTSCAVAWIRPHGTTARATQPKRKIRDTDDRRSGKIAGTICPQRSDGWHFEALSVWHFGGLDKVIGGTLGHYNTSTGGTLGHPHSLASGTLRGMDHKFPLERIFKAPLMMMIFIKKVIINHQIVDVNFLETEVDSD